MPDTLRNGGSSPEGGASDLRESLRGPAAVAGYVAFYVALVAVFVCSFLGSFGSAWAIALFIVLGLVVVAGIAVNYDRALDLFRTRRAAAGASVALSIAAGLVILVAVNWLSSRHRLTLDITENQWFTLDERTLNWLSTLDSRGRDMRIVTFLPYKVSQFSGLPPDYKRRIEGLLNLYEEEGRRLSVTHTAPLAERARMIYIAQEIGIDAKNIPNDTVVFKYGDKRKDLGVGDIFQMAPRNPYTRQGMPAVFRGEDAITSVIRDLLDEKSRKVYFVTGHGERTTGYDPGDYSAVVEKLRSMNFKVENLSLAGKSVVPEDASCVVVAGPTRPIPDDELGGLEDYLEGGGRLLVMLDFLDRGAAETTSGLERVLDKYGVKVRQDVMALAPEVAFLGVKVIGVPHPRHDISKPLVRLKAMFYRACVLEKNRSPEKSGYDVSPVVEGTDGSWGERRLKKTPRYDAGEDVAGPTILAMAVGPKSGPGGAAGPASIVVFSDADFLSNQFVADREFKFSANVDLFLNAVNWMVGRTANIGIEPKERDRRTAVITPRRRRRLFWGAVVFPTVLMVALGLVVWRLRSR